MKYIVAIFEKIGNFNTYWTPPTYLVFVLCSKFRLLQPSHDLGETHLVVQRSPPGLLFNIVSKNTLSNLMISMG